MTFKIKLLRIGYIFGISLLLASIIYFFAANWGGLERLEKIGLSAGLVAIFYACSFLPAKLKVIHAHQSFLGRLLLAGGLVAFGAAKALVDQTYNAHADHYGLFLIWCIPALLFSIVIRHSWFYLLTFVLAHLSLWFYFFPSSVFVVHSDAKQALIFGLFAVLNLVLFILTEAGWIRSSALRRASFIVFHIAALWLSNSFITGEYGYILNVATVLALVSSFYYLGRIRTDRWGLSVTALFASAYAVLKFIELAEEHYSEWFFLYGLFFVGMLLAGNVLFYRYMSKIKPKADSTEAANPEKPDGRDSGQLTAKIVSTIVTIVGVIVGTVSLTGLVFLASFAVDPENVLFVLSLLFTIPMILIPRMNAVVRYTVLTIGYMAGIVAILWFSEPLLSALYLILAAAGWIRLDGRIERLFTYLVFNIVLAITFFQFFDAWSSVNFFSYVLMLLIAANAIVYALHYMVANETIRGHMRASGLYFALIYSFWLTFMEDTFLYSYALFNIAFFLIITLLVFANMSRERDLDATICLILWFGFVGFKYYDLIWPLLHKSFTLLLLGILFLAGTTLLERRFSRGTPPPVLIKRTVPYARWLPILLIILLQFAFIGYQTVSSERLLASGTSIKLELEPVDPRSMLQGDYVRLGYTISSPPEHIAKELSESNSLNKVHVVVKKDSRGVHQFDRIYQEGELLKAGEVMLTGRTDGSMRILYGIETYFIPEGTGLEVERNARFAYVRVGGNGNALLERLTSE